MMEASSPQRSVKLALRSESTGKAELAFMLCGKPSEWPTSWAATYWISRPIRESGRGRSAARSSSGPTCTKYQSWARFITLWNIWMSASRISPVRGSWTWGPMAFSICDGTQRITE